VTLSHYGSRCGVHNMDRGNGVGDSCHECAHESQGSFSVKRCGGREGTGSEDQVGMVAC